MIEIVVLYVLNKYDATIYRLIKIIDELFFAYIKTGTGTINPALKRLHSLGCVEYSEKMSDGGMLSKIYSITPVGKKHLKDLLLSFEVKNPYHIINDVNIALSCSGVLNSDEIKEFKNNILNFLQYYKITLEKGLKNEYLSLDNMQKSVAGITLEQVEKMISIL